MQRCRGPSIPGGALGPECRGRRGYGKDCHEHGVPVLVARAEDTRVRDPGLPTEEAIVHRQEEDRQDLNLFLFLLFLSSFRFIAKSSRKDRVLETKHGHSDWGSRTFPCASCSPSSTASPTTDSPRQSGPLVTTSSHRHIRHHHAKSTVHSRVHPS